VSTPGVAVTLWVLFGCGAFGEVGSVGPCTFIEMKDCLARAEQVQKEQRLPDRPPCLLEEVEVWWQ
jgi:hypothetical protein